MSDGEARLDRRYIEMTKLLNLYLNQFPSSEKFGLAQRIRQACYEVYELIIEAQKRYQKKTTLTNLDIRHETLRMLVRLAYELGHFRHGVKGKPDPDAEATRRYLALSRRIDEVGRLIGGWVAAERKKLAAA